MLSVVINAQNVEKELETCLKSVKDLSSEIVVIDQESIDNTAKVAKKFGAKVYSHKKVPYVELARNFALEKARGDWVLLLDPDEEVSKTLRAQIDNIIKNPKADYYRLPRKNIIFGKWIEHTLWWPDYQIRLFKKGFVVWHNEIHSIPITQGRGLDLPDEEKYAITHNNYQFVDQYIEKLSRYTSAQAKDSTEKFEWKNLIRKPVNEFINRYFNGKGYLDGVHGLALSLMQSFSELIVVVKIWQNEKFKEEDVNKKEIKQELNKSMHDVKWWIRKEFSWLKNLV